MYFPVPGEVTPEWLTAVLHQAEVIGPGEVTAVKVQATGAFNSHTSHLIAMVDRTKHTGCPKWSVSQRHFKSGIVKICSECRITAH
jgi:hypothetical protein